jgi:hypothetical protein
MEAPVVAGATPGIAEIVLCSGNRRLRAAVFRSRRDLQSHAAKRRGKLIFLSAGLQTAPGRAHQRDKSKFLLVVPDKGFIVNSGF